MTSICLIYVPGGGGYGGRASGDDDNQTIRTEDFVDKFQDTMVYSSGRCVTLVAGYVT